MMGNLHEWTREPDGTFRGGFYVDTQINGNTCLLLTTAHASSRYDYGTGFRCCAGDCMTASSRDPPRINIKMIDRASRIDSGIRLA